MKLAGRAVSWARALLFVSLLASATSCNLGASSPIEFGRDSSHACKMMFTDKRFGGEAVFKKGKVYKFDALECMLPFLDDNRADLGKVYVLTAEANGELLSADEAVFMIDPKLKSPMGKGILAAKNAEVLRKIIGPRSAPYPVYRWADLVTQLKSTARSGP